MSGTFITLCKDDNIPEIIKLLNSDEYTDFNIQDEEGQTGFIYACVNNNIELVKILLNTDKDINYNIFDNYKFTGFHHACGLNNEEIVKLLISKGNESINFNLYDDVSLWTGFIYACDNNSYDVVEILLQYNNLINFNCQTVSGKTGFISACFNRSFKMVDLFLKCNHTEIDFTLTDSTGNTGYDYLINHPMYKNINYEQHNFNPKHLKIILELSSKMFSGLNEKISELQKPKIEPSYLNSLKQSFYEYFNLN
jgi:ankyrin repeat protein